MWSYCSHDGVPCGGEDVGVVVALVMSLQLLGEVLSCQLGRSGEAGYEKKKSLKVSITAGFLTTRESISTSGGRLVSWTLG